MSITVATERKPRLLFLLVEDWWFYRHRLDLAVAAREAGWDVSVAVRVNEHGKRIEEAGLKLLPIKLMRQSRQPVREATAVAELVRLYRRERPDVVHQVAMKPILYGSWAARLAGVPAVVNEFAGLGYAFAEGSQRARVIRSVLQPALKQAIALPRTRVIFQNKEDLGQFAEAGVVRRNESVVMGGFGVDVEKFKPQPEPEDGFVVMLASRMLWDKGIGVFVEASRLLRDEGVRAKCVLVGTPDEGNPQSIPEAQLRAWHSEGAVEWWEHRDDMPGTLAAAHVVTLPTFYREGLPTVLLEAAACARPMIATNAPGCWEIVRHGDNGLLIPPKDPAALAQAIKSLAADPAMRARMGARGREIAVQEFSIERVTTGTLSLYAELLKEQHAASAAHN